MIVLVFPGQGSQKIGMGKSLYENFPKAREVFDEVDDALGFKLSSLMFNGDINELSLTYNAQPALMATSLAILRVIEESVSKKLDNLVKITCGHSLGEFSALCASSVISLSDTAKLLKIRGDAMQKAVPKGKGAMAALISNDFSQLDSLLKEANTHGICEVANDNSNEQIVVSGEHDAIKKVVEIASDFSIRKVIELNVSAPFHCSLMKPAQDKLELELENVNFLSPQIPIICNYNAKLEKDINLLKQNIIKQVTNKVRWRETMDLIQTQNITQIVELGSGKVLTGMAKRRFSEIDCYNIETEVDLENNLHKFD